MARIYTREHPNCCSAVLPLTSFAPAAPSCGCFSASAAVSLRVVKAKPVSLVLLGSLSGCAKSHSRVTSAPAMLISLIADVWERGGSKAVPGEGWRARGSAVPSCPCISVGKRTATPCYLSAGETPLAAEPDPAPANISCHLQVKAGDTVPLEEEQAEMLGFACAQCPGSQPDVLLNLSGGCGKWWASARGFTVQAGRNQTLSKKSETAISCKCTQGCRQRVPARGAFSAQGCQCTQLCPGMSSLGTHNPSTSGL